MNSSHQISFRVSCSIGNERIVGVAVVDRKNSSVHLHLYAEMFGSKQTPIQVRNSDIELQAGKESELITKILMDHFSDNQFRIESIEKLSETQESSIPGQPLRIIVRLKDYR